MSSIQRVALRNAKSNKNSRSTTRLMDNFRICSIILKIETFMNSITSRDHSNHMIKTMKNHLTKFSKLTRTHSKPTRTIIPRSSLPNWSKWNWSKTATRMASVPPIWWRMKANIDGRVEEYLDENYTAHSPSLNSNPIETNYYYFSKFF